MKKAIVWILVLTLCLSMCACGKKADDNGAANTTGTTGAVENDSTTGTTGETTTQTTENTEATQGEQTPKPTEAPKPTTPKPTEAPKPTTPSHTHSWSAATCTAPKTCACGATEGAAAGHNWKAATCTAPKTCATCGATEGDALGHTLTATCANCGQVNAGFAQVDNSTWVYDSEKDGRRTSGTYIFSADGDEKGVSLGFTFYKRLDKYAQENNMTQDAVREDFGPDMVFKFDGVEYVYDGWGMENSSSRRYKEENGTVTIEFLSLDWDDNDNEIWTVINTAVLKRTGLAELTVTSSNHSSVPVGLKLTPKNV